MDFRSYGQSLRSQGQTVGHKIYQCQFGKLIGEDSFYIDQSKSQVKVKDQSLSCNSNHHIISFTVKLSRLIIYWQRICFGT